MGSVELGKGLLETSYGDNPPHALQKFLHPA